MCIYISVFIYTVISHLTSSFHMSSIPMCCFVVFLRVFPCLCVCICVDIWMKWFSSPATECMHTYMHKCACLYLFGGALLHDACDAARIPYASLHYTWGAPYCIWLSCACWLCCAHARTWYATMYVVYLCPVLCWHMTIQRYESFCLTGPGARLDVVYRLRGFRRELLHRRLLATCKARSVSEPTKCLGWRA